MDTYLGIAKKMLFCYRRTHDLNNDLFVYFHHQKSFSILNQIILINYEVF